jgi:hypothetical protein
MAAPSPVSPAMAPTIGTARRAPGRSPPAFPDGSEVYSSSGRIASGPDAGAGDLLAFLEQEVGLRCESAASSLRPGAPHAVILIQEALRRSNEIPDVPRSRVTPPPVKEELRPTPRLDVVEVAERCGLSLFYAPAAHNDWRARDGRREDKGNAILATVPLSDPIVLEPPFEAAQRVIPFATMRSVGGDSLRVATVHRSPRRRLRGPCSRAGRHGSGRPWGCCGASSGSSVIAAPVQRRATSPGRTGSRRSPPVISTRGPTARRRCATSGRTSRTRPLRWPSPHAARSRRTTCCSGAGRAQVCGCARAATAGWTIRTIRITIPSLP